MVRTDNVHTVIESIKPAYDGNGIIVRIYNDTPEMQATTVVGAFNQICETNMLEEKTFVVKNHIVFKPFEIKTFRLNN